MHRLSRKQIETLVVVKLATAPALVEQRLRSKLTSDRDWARAELARTIAAELDNNTSMVVVTELLEGMTYPHRGTWDVDEPSPATLPQPPSAPISL